MVQGSGIDEIRVVKNWKYVNKKVTNHGKLGPSVPEVWKRVTLAHGDKQLCSLSFSQSFSLSVFFSVSIALSLSLSLSGTYIHRKQRQTHKPLK